ncbi:VWA domain-containing protein [Acidobacteria bacterium AH-259-G07]|nr:VWA domain-containing protein [Acidobacteria bacterium AH-259-G07]
MRNTIKLVILAATMLGMLTSGWAAGTLTATDADVAPIQIRDHHVKIIINNGFARTEVYQTFFNPNDRDLAALYSFPLPKSASLSEVTVYADERELHGEVIEKQRASRIYREERDKGNNVALAEKRDFQAFDFAVSPVRARQETRIRFVYYQPLQIDTGVGRYLYPLEEGGTDEVALHFWDTNTLVNGPFSVDLEFKSAAPVMDVRVPGFEAAAKITKVAEGHYKLEMKREDARLDRDFVFCYRLEDNLPGRIELIPYRLDENTPGTFMLVVTPGLDLQPLKQGADYTFVLDVSGSMRGKISTLARGVAKVIGQMKPEDRIRIIVFNDSASDLSGGWVPASRKNVQRLVQAVQQLQASRSTNLYAGLKLALKNLDDDRSTSIVLITDAVTNTGIIEPREFHKLMKQYDVRIFGFLMGNSANWSLMRTISETSGGFYANVSNSDDIVGQIMLAKSKITYECLHDASLKISGVKVYDIGNSLGKIYRGQQLVIFGRYDKGGKARVTLQGRLTGEDKTYSTTFQFPDVDTENPEIERLWALAQIEELEVSHSIGDMEVSEFESAVRDLGLTYQLVTDYTSMLVLTDESFAERGIERRNQARTAQEWQAQTMRAQQPARNWRVDQANPAFSSPAPSVGGGALDPFSAGIALILTGLAIARLARRRAQAGHRS